MKTQKKLLASLFVMLFLATGAMAQISGSAHDFQTDAWNNTGEICVVCHTPHDAKSGVADAPLWNHQLTSATFTIYSTSTMDATTGQPDGASKLCLSCHDGSVALDNFGSQTNGTTFLTGSELLGTDISNDHPVSFTYDASLATADGELNDPTTVNSGLGGTIDADMLVSNKMECSSCHDVHNTVAVNGTKLLVKSNSASGLCLTCHAK